jgi:hypothetical protein
VPRTYPPVCAPGATKEEAVSGVPLCVSNALESGLWRRRGGLVSDVSACVEKLLEAFDIRGVFFQI